MNHVNPYLKMCLTKTVTQREKDELPSLESLQHNAIQQYVHKRLQDLRCKIHHAVASDGSLAEDTVFLDFEGKDPGIVQRLQRICALKGYTTGLVYLENGIRLKVFLTEEAVEEVKIRRAHKGEEIRLFTEPNNDR